ncbi:hypothetical protein [Fluviicola sp.]|uniref:hypothetical protein n=1 Tax=Fluviicola sp. TaxID=1917219 RepID=UPI0026321FFB|nr:hypothetical protein [Fluviicola sp.]
MTVRTFWHLIIKSLGIWIVIHGIMSVPDLILRVTVAYASPYADSPVFIGIEVVFFAIQVLFYLFILRFLILKTQWIIDTLKLENGFNETKIDFSLPFDKVLRIIVILMGGFIFVIAIPTLVEAVYLFITDNLPFRDSPRNIIIVSNAVQATIGFLMMNNSDIVLRYIHKKSSESETKQLDKEEF